MGYATVSHVQALTPLRAFSATTRPTATQVVGFLEETAAIIDSALAGRGFTLPVPTTATTALKLFELYNARGAWAMVEAAAESSPDEAAADAAWANAQKMLEAIEPPGLTRETTTTRARGMNVATPYFTRDMVL